MIRPKLRPTLSRRVKYLGIAPHAQVKLEREARRGSHDLRKLVGHANFLDVLIDTLEPVEDLTSLEEAASHQDVDGTENVEHDDLSSDEWSDSSDDDDHALSRTISASELARLARKETRAAIEQIDDDYFGLRQSGKPAIVVTDVVADGEKKGVEVSVSAISPSSDGSLESPELEDLAMGQDVSSPTPGEHGSVLL